MKVGDTVSGSGLTLRWSSDWSGDEVGFPDVPVVGYYYIVEIERHVYIDTEDGTILEIFEPDDEE